MSQGTILTTRQRQSPQQYLVSTMVQATSQELETLINQELEKNVALEVVDPSDEAYDAQENFYDDEAGEPSANEASEVGDADDVADRSLSDEERGDKVMLEYDDDEPINTSSNVSSDDEGYNPVQGAMSEEDFREDLKRQIDMLDNISKQENFIAKYLIDCLDEDGYLRRPLVQLVDDLEFTQHVTTTEEDLEAVLVEIVQEELDPSGIGARDLRECLLLQLQERKGTPATRLAYAIVEQAFDDLSEKRYDRIQQGFGVRSHQLFVDAIRAIQHLNPKPGNMQPAAPKSAELRMQQVRVDFAVRNEDDQLVVSLLDDRVPQVRISADTEHVLERLKHITAKHDTKDNRDGIRFLSDNIRKGRDFIDALQQRRNTLIEVMQTIVQMQREYFLTGQIESLQPMTLQDVADRCDYDISTISRVSNSKFVDTEFGTIPLKNLFTNAVADSNQTAVKAALKELIDAEDKTQPMTDEVLAERLKQEGYSISRRTVVKYREMLGIPMARHRKEL